MILEDLDGRTETFSNENELPGDPDNTVATVSLMDLYPFTKVLARQQGTSLDSIATPHAG